MAFDTPQLGGYRLENPPDDLSISWEVVQQLHELADGSTRQRILGYRIRASMNWDQNWVREHDLTGLIGVANDISASLSVIPPPASNPPEATASFALLSPQK